jgi:outer membrane receptor protein involved in Fe transport
MTRDARRRSLALTLALIALLGFGSVNPAMAAQQPPPKTPPNAQPTPTFQTEVVVTPERGADDRERLPVSTATLTRGQLDVRPAATLADAVQTLPGFQILSAGVSGLAPSSIARGFFGGGEAEYVKALLDGVPLGDAESGVVDWRRVPAFAIHRIEALRGPASPVYGDAALGGVIQLFTLAPATRIVRVDASGGSFGSASAGVEFGQPFGGATFQALGSYDRSEGFREHSDLLEGFGSIAVLRADGPHQWTARGVLNYVDRDEPGPLTGAELVDRETSNPLFRFDNDTARRGYGAFRYGSTAGPLSYSVLGHISGRSGDRLRTVLLAPGIGDRANREVSSGSAGASVENSVNMSFGGTSGHLRFGLDISRDHLETSYQAVAADGVIGPEVGSLTGRRSRFAGYATQAVNVGSRATLHAGVRWDGLRDSVAGGSTRASHDAWSPRAGGAVSIADRTLLFAQFSRAFKAPTLDQLFDPRPFPDFQGGTFLISTASLRPQRSTNIEGGIRQTRERYRWEAVLYRMNVRDEIDFDPATFQYGNIGQSRHEGLEVDAALFQGSRLAVSANYAWTRVIPGLHGEGLGQLKNIPRHLFRPDITVTLPRRTTVHARYTRTGGAYADDENLVPLGGRSTIDVRVRKLWSRLAARLDLLNITNDRYEEVGFVLADFRGGAVPYYHPAPGFAMRAGLELAF